MEIVQIVFGCSVVGGETGGDGAPAGSLGAAGGVATTVPSPGAHRFIVVVFQNDDAIVEASRSFLTGPRVGTVGVGRVCRP